ncbi:hypothetical protein RSAG8_12629, partial [Rhizoctonia solani AG-8 WAC10335]
MALLHQVLTKTKFFWLASLTQLNAHIGTPSTHTAPRFPEYYVTYQQPPTSNGNTTAPLFLPEVPRDSLPGVIDGQTRVPGDSNTPQTIVANSTHNTGNPLSMTLTSQAPTPRLSNTASTSFCFSQMPYQGRDKKKLKCDICTKSFHRKYQLNDHMRQHRGQPKAYTCNFSGCDKAYTSRANMRRHYHTVHGSAMQEDNVSAEG